MRMDGPPDLTPAERVVRLQEVRARDEARASDAAAHRLRSIKRRKRLARRIKRIGAMQLEILTRRMMRRVKKPRPGRSRPRAERRKRGCEA